MFMTYAVHVQPDDSLVTVGMADGLLSMQRRKDDKQLVAEFEEKKRRKHAMKRRFKFATALYSYKASKVSGAWKYKILPHKNSYSNANGYTVTYNKISFDEMWQWYQFKLEAPSFLFKLISSNLGLY